MLSAQELAQWQTDAAAYTCDQPCAIYLPTHSKDVFGSPTLSYPGTPSSTVLAGMSLPSAGELANYAYEIGDKNSWTVRFPIGTNVVEQAHLVIAGQTLEVHILLNPRSYPALLSVIAVEIK